MQNIKTCILLILSKYSLWVVQTSVQQIQDGRHFAVAGWQRLQQILSRVCSGSFPWCNQLFSGPQYTYSLKSTRNIFSYSANKQSDRQTHRQTQVWTLPLPTGSRSNEQLDLRKEGVLLPAEKKAEPVADNVRRPLENFVDCAITGPSDAPVGGNICTEGQCAGNDPIQTHTHACIQSPDMCTSIHSALMMLIFAIFIPISV